MTATQVLRSPDIPLAHLRQPPFFEGLNPVELRVIISEARVRHFAAGTVVYHQEQLAKHTYLLTRGRARYFYIAHDGKKILLRWFRVGEIFGGAAILRLPSLYLISAETLHDCTALTWDHETMRELVTRYPRLLDNAVTIAHDYLSMFLASLVAVSCDSASQRLAQVLMTLAECVGHTCEDGVEVEVTNEELAQAANVTLFTASRQISDWSRRKALKKKRGKILLRSPERLFLPQA
jgi:CRP-like cAMP-binding protein